MSDQRLIDANALKAKAFDKRGGLIHTADIDAMPTIEERKTGKWNRRKGMYEIGFKCSECNTFSIAETPYCSFCGSHMVQEGEDNG